MHLSELKQSAYNYYHHGNLEKAMSLFKKVIKTDKLDIDSYIALGVIHQDLCLYKQAENYLHKATHLAPDNAEAYCYLGILYEETKQSNKAINSFQKAIKINPADAWFYFNLANSLDTVNKLDSAVEYYQRALSLDPQYTQAYINLGISLATLGKLNEAIANYKEGIKLQPNEPLAHYNLGIALLSLGDNVTAIQSFQTVLKLNPNHPDAHKYLGNAYLNLRMRDQAIACYEHCLVLNPGDAQAQLNLSMALLELGRLTEAKAAIQKALDIDPDYPEALGHMASLMMEFGLATSALEYFRKSLKINPAQPKTQSNLLLCLNYLPAYSNQAIFEEHQYWANLQYASTSSWHDFKPRELSGRRIKIAYISPDLRSHPVAQFIEPILSNHNKKDFEIFCYADVLFPNHITEHLQSLVENWRNVAGQDDSTVTETILNDEIDILVDLSGHTGKNRLGIFARRAAPIQVTYLGYANTTGLPNMDYRISDCHVDPETSSDQYYTEKLIRLPHTFCCYQAVANSPDVKPPPVLNNGYITFGSFNNLVKINDQVIALWSRILNSVPGSRLLLKSGGLHEAKICQRIIDEFAEHGVSKGQLILEGKDDKYLQRYTQVDIGLDPFPWNGGTTSFDMVWMGVPFITLAGETNRSRMGVAILENLGLAEFVANDPDAYVTHAINLASDIPLLQQLHAQLRERLQNSALMDAQQFTHQLETAYRKIWLAWCKNTPHTESLKI